MIHSFRDAARTREKQSVDHPNRSDQPTEMSGTKIMFTAVADKGGNLGPFEADTTVVYNKVITNIGNAYDGTSGIFKAPVAGYYYFTFFYHAGANSKSALKLMKSDSCIVEAFEKNPGSADNAGNAAFLQLNENDQVYVRLSPENRIWASGYTTTFSGFLVSGM
ncbi:complement C1q tumor necrosis factor-related protein 2-like isoform X2 [Dicentrarchus labrax]|nr:complement C1q tumor necrosis factor-related protein 2-like isoform X1 [Dicentrarchus labrax]XP_051257826.1 complement C1q tumor necrosis factor-related protein 2-like isoform X2 [Dicentrarchus labrax]